MRTENQPRPSRLLRVREFTEKVTKQRKKPSKTTSGKSRFVAPYYFSGDEQAAIAKVLRRHQIGDAEGVMLFVTAAEYEIGSLRPALLEEPSPQAPAPQPKTQTKADIELTQLGQSAARLQAMLQATHNTAKNRLTQALNASDPFARRHDASYLAQLELELGRIATACEHMQDEQTQPAAVAPVAGPTATKLIRQLARIYTECLDVQPDTDQDGAFGSILTIIRDSAEIPLPCDSDSLARLLTP